MSVAAPASSRLKSWHRFSLRPSRVYFWGVSLLWLAIVGWNLATQGFPTASDALALVPWIIALVVVNMLPVKTWPHADFTPDEPIFIAGALVLSPLEIGIANFIGCFDPREFQGRTTLGKAIFNRSQAGLVAYASSLLAHNVASLPASSVFVLLLD